MVEIEIDGKKVEVPAGSMVMDAANKLGTYIPHFCYHKKLSIAANCRMCLVEVEKAPKPLPACATPVSAGMIVRSASDKAVQAQKSVMEFLLINHPLDCPICDQGGECQLQDLRSATVKVPRAMKKKSAWWPRSRPARWCRWKKCRAASSAPVAYALARKWPA